MKLHTIAAALSTAACISWAQSYTWTDITPNVSFPSVSTVGTHPLDARRIIVHGSFSLGEKPGTGTVSVMYSDDRGNTWNAPAASLPNTQDMFVHVGLPGVVYLTQLVHRAYPSLGDPGREGHLYRSNDFGRSWSVASTTSVASAALTPDSFLPFGSDPLDPSRLYAMHEREYDCGFPRPDCGYTAAIGMAQSPDGGSSWGATGLPLLSSSFYFSPAGPTPAAPTTLFVSRFDGVLASRDRGATWSAFAPVLETPLQWARPDPVQADVLYGHRYFIRYDTHYLLVQSQDGGSSWRTIFDSLYHQPQLTIDPVRSRILWITEREGLYRSGDRGDTWQLVPYPVSNVIPNNQDPGASLFASAADPGTVYLIRGVRLFRGVPSVLPDPVVVEFQYEGDRYWATSLDGEAVSQGYRLEPGHVSRTGVKWGAWRADDAPAGALGSCRFWPKPETGLRTRVLLLQGYECDILKRTPGWILEAENDFYAIPPTAAGDCASGLVPVRRFHNTKADMNHRWVADPAVAEDMRARRWYDEGVRFCARPLGSNE